VVLFVTPYFIVLPVTALHHSSILYCLILRTYITGLKKTCFDHKFVLLLRDVRLFFRYRLYYFSTAILLQSLPKSFHFSVQEYFRMLMSNVTIQCFCFVVARSRVQIPDLRGSLLCGCDLMLLVYR